MRNEKFDPIEALYKDAEALREIAGKYREEKGRPRLPPVDGGR